ncbi:MAG: C45 family peptidase [Isosphaeraceae bacterium]|nr:C45 family peptidase [Isosphaeraceae bacterium]
MARSIGNGLRPLWILGLFPAICFVLAGSAHAETKTIARCGRGFLEEVDGYRVLHVKGSPYEMGYQQGALLRDSIRANVDFLFNVKAKEFEPPKIGGVAVPVDPKKIIAGISERQRKYTPARFYEEMRGVADGAGLPVEDIVTANFIPELFHCSGFAISGKATADGSLYHGRILDYGCDWRLQDHAILTVAEPDGKIPFVNVTYAGFVGSVTGMNARKISIGEMGGKGLGLWEGVPMAFLVRWALEEANTLDEAIAVFRDHPRTCEYYYVIADGKSGKGVGMEASAGVFSVVAMGESHPKLPAAIEDAVCLSGGDRYQELVRRVREGHGRFDAASALRLMDRPVAMKSNLHSVLFETTTTRFWVANASSDGRPAAEQPYHAFQLSTLLEHRADPSARALSPAPSRPAAETLEAAASR